MPALKPMPGADKFTWTDFTVVKPKALAYRAKLALLLDKDEHGYGSYPRGAGGAPETTVYGPGKSVQLPGRYDTTKLPKDTMAVTSKHGYALLSKSSNNPAHLWISHIRVDDKAQGKGEGTALLIAALKAGQAQGYTGILRGDALGRGVSSGSHALWASLGRKGLTEKLTVTTTDPATGKPATYDTEVLVRTTPKTALAGDVSALELGDVDGHPFRGNQWTTGGHDTTTASPEHEPNVYKDGSRHAARGIVANPDELPVATARRFVDGTATVDDVLSVIDTKSAGGNWWDYASDEKRAGADPEGYAEVEHSDSVVSGLKAYESSSRLTPWRTDPKVHASIGVILHGKLAKGVTSPSVESGWNSDYTQRNNLKIPLTWVQYNAGNGWKSVRAPGRSVTIEGHHEVRASVTGTPATYLRDTYRGLFDLYSPDQPRDDAGRFGSTGTSPYAAAPRVFNTPEDVIAEKNWGQSQWAWKDEKTGKGSGMLLTGEPIPRETLPETLYHVTTNAPAVEASGVLLGQRSHAGLGGGQADGVSFTSSKTDARVIQRELTRSVKIARGDDVGMPVIERYAREDEREAGLPAGTLDRAVASAREGYDGNKFLLDKTYVQGEGYTNTPPSPAERDRIHASITKDALNAYLNARQYSSGDAGKLEILKNPILFGNQERLKTLDPANIKTLTVPTKNIPKTALITTGSDKFLHEVRAYADVPSGGTVAHVLSYRDRLQMLLREYARDDKGRFAAADATDYKTKTGIGEIVHGVVNSVDLEGHDPGIVTHSSKFGRESWGIRNAFRYNKGVVDWNAYPTPDQYFKVENHFAKKGWKIDRHQTILDGVRIPEPEPESLSYRDKLQTLLLDFDEALHPRDEKGKFASGGGGVSDRMAVLKDKYPEVAANYAKDSGTEMGSIEAHTGDVGREWEKQLTPEEMSGISERFGSDVQKLMASAIPLHDIGKPAALEAGDKRDQHKYTVPILQDVLRKEGFSEKDVALATELLNHDKLGALMQRSSRDSAATVADQLAAKAAKVGMSTKDFATLQMAFYNADGSAYPYVTQFMKQESSGKWTFEHAKQLAPIVALAKGATHLSTYEVPPFTLDFDEGQHPRDDHGRFASGDSATGDTPWVDADGLTHVGKFVELYHGTSARRATTIGTEGLRIRAVQKQTMGGDPEHNRDYVWLAKDKGAAARYAAMHSQPAVVTIRMPHAELKKNDPYGRNSGPDSVWMKQAIPAKYIHSISRVDTTALTHRERLALVQLEWDESQHPRDDHGKFATGDGGTASGLPAEKRQEMQDALRLQHEKPVHQVDTPEQAVALVLKGENVEIKDVKDVHTVLALLAEKAKEGKDFDPCQVTVKGVSLFCSEMLKTKEFPNGIPRIEMPQFKTKNPIPGSPAASMPKNEKGEVDVKQQFLTYLTHSGIKTTETDVLARKLKASQAEMEGAKVAGMMLNPKFDPKDERVLVSSDNYVIDGHHTWAAAVGRDAADGNLSNDKKMKVLKVDMPMSEVYHLSTKWTKAMGMPTAGVQKHAHSYREKLALLLADAAWSEDQHPRDPMGRFASTGEFGDFKQRLAAPDAGFSVQVMTGHEPHGAGYYGVSVHPDRTQVVNHGIITAQHLYRFARANRTLLRQPGNYFGAWHDPKTGNVFLDVSVVTKSPGDAEALARQHHELAYFDYGAGKSVPIDYTKKNLSGRLYGDDEATYSYPFGPRRDFHAGRRYAGRALRGDADQAHRPDDHGHGAGGPAGGDHGRHSGGAGLGPLAAAVVSLREYARDDRGRFSGDGGGGGDGSSELNARDRARDEKFKEGLHRLAAQQHARTARAQAIAARPPADYTHNQATHAQVEGRLKELAPKVFVSEKKQTAITAASHVADVLTEMQAQGYAMPDSVTVKLSDKMSLYGSVSYGKDQRDLTITVPKELPSMANLDHAAEIAFGGQATATGDPGGPYDRFVARSMNDVVRHEMGHVQSPLPSTVRAVTAPAEREAMRKVSLYAATNPSEFLAESFVKLNRGETLPADSARLYKSLGGPAIKRHKS